MQSQQNIPVFILAGGTGTRLSEETQLKPKPMIEIGEIPILIHIMRSYYAHGFNNFVICGGYRCWEIKQYFLNYEFRANHLSIDHRDSPHSPPVSLGQSAGQERWWVRVIDTGNDSMTGCRIARAFDEVSKTDHFSTMAITYGDGVSDVDLTAELKFHQSHGKIGTVLGVVPSARFGILDVNSNHGVEGFLEKPETTQDRVNGGFFFLNKEFREYLNTYAQCIMEREPLEKLAQDNQLMAFNHSGFWQPMDTLRDKNYLQSLWEKGNAPWSKKRSE